MGYSPTEYAEFTEPPTEMSSHGFHRSAQMLGCAVLPQNSQNSQNLVAWVWQGCHTLLHLCASVPSVGVLSLQGVLCILCIPWESLSSHGWHGSTQIVRCAVLPQNLAAWVWQGCHTLLHLCASVLICGRLFSARSFCAFRAFCGNLFPPTDFTDLHRYLGCAVLPRNSQNPQNLSAWVWQGCHTLLICAHPCHLWEALLCKRFCEFRAFRGSFFTACFVGAAETAAPPGGIHRSSVQISPFHLEPSLLHVLPVLWVRLRHHLRLVDAQPGEHDCRRCERHRHAVVVVGVDRL